MLAAAALVAGCGRGADVVELLPDEPPAAAPGDTDLDADGEGGAPLPDASVEAAPDGEAAASACDTSAQCAPPEVICDQGDCVECVSDNNCAGTSRPRCEATRRRCVACVGPGDCAAPRGICDASGRCVECAGDADCAGASRPRCDVSAGRCVECLAAGDCELPGATCVNGRCGCGGADPAICDDRCVDLASDDDHCGRCDEACPAGSSCHGGECACAPGVVVCELRGVPTCVPVATDPRFCGTSCGDVVSCASTEWCDRGACACLPGLDACGGACVDTKTDPGHCGHCNAPCAPGEACNGGKCGAPATSQACEQRGLASCDGSCLDLARDPRSCGKCGRVCHAGELCADGVCRDYASLAPCTQCPCPMVCDQGSSVACCATGPGGIPGPFCVAGGPGEPCP